MEKKTGLFIGGIIVLGAVGLVAYLYSKNQDAQAITIEKEKAQKQLANAKTDQEKQVAQKKVDELIAKEEKAKARITVSNDLEVFDMFDPNYYKQFDVTGANKIKSLDSSVDSIAVNLHNELNDSFINQKRIYSYLQPVDTKAKVSQLSGYYYKLYGKTLDIDLQNMSKGRFEELQARLASLPRA